MKVLFAVNNDDISNAIIKKYQKDYKQILSYKNVYYFNAILKELQKDKSYDRVVISEDLEPFANNNYDTIDKFLFEKLDKISDETMSAESNDTDIILICTDRRRKSDEMLNKFFGIGIYNAIVGQDRSIEEVCKLINKPRTKKEAKNYYKIDTDNLNYQVESEDSVSETEVQNIIAHYRRLGNNEDKFVESFNNIVSQYTDNQLKIIIRYLPIKVKAVLEEKSPKYQQLVTEEGQKREKKYKQQYNSSYEAKKQEPIKVKMIKEESEKSKIKGPIVIPSGVNKQKVKKLLLDEENMKNHRREEKFEDLEDKNMENIEEQTKRGRGRPRKVVDDTEKEEITDNVKRGRGRPRKTAIVEDKKDLEQINSIDDNEDDDIDLFNLNSESETEVKEDTDLFELNNASNSNDDNEIDLFNMDDTEETKQENNDNDIDLFDMVSIEHESKNENEDISEVNLFDLSEEDDEQDLSFLEQNEENEEDNSNVFAAQKSDVNIVETQYKPVENSFSGAISKDNKIICFVGTTKNGTSFIVNNSAHLLASRGIKTAVLDMTKTKNAYYIYTNSDERLMNVAKSCIQKLKNGVAEGIKINKFLDIYTSVPEDGTDFSNVNSIIETLAKNYNLVLIDCDFDTPMEYFGVSQEIYLVQSMDVLTMQPLTAFLRNMQSKGFLQQEKLKVVINKGVNIKSVPIKILIGGISKYNDPAMTYMKDLFDKDKINYCVIPFEVPNYIKYLDSIINCQITLNGYTKDFMTSLNELGNMIYPVLNKQTYSPMGDKYNNNLSNDINDTLDKMKRKYN